MEKESKVCANCKRVNAHEANFCQYCGTDLSKNWIEVLDKKIIGHLVSIAVSIVTTLTVLTILKII